jgi:hypothetical protein
MPSSHFKRRKLLAQAETGLHLPHDHGFPLYGVPCPSSRHVDAPEFNPLYDLANDPRQERPIRDPVLEARLAGQLRGLLQKCQAPPCQFERSGL